MNKRNRHHESCLLLSQDFRSGKGGIARVARLMDAAFSFTSVLSLHGTLESDGRVFYFKHSRILFLKEALQIIFFRKPAVIAFDHLYLSRLLALVPQLFLKKVIIFLHDEEGWQKVKGLSRVGLNKASHILCNSNYTMQLFLKHNPEFAYKTKVCLPGGISEAFERSNRTQANNSWFQDSSPYCLFVSRFWKVHRYKGYFELLNAFKDYYKKIPEAKIRLALVGNGDDADEVAAFIEKENLSGKVSLFRGLSDEELGCFYKNATCLMFPSSREGFGMVFLEAMYFKKACIGLLGQPAEEIIVDQKTGRLIGDNRPETLIRIIQDVEKNPEKYREMGERGLERYMDLFTKEHFNKRFLEAIGE